MASGGALVPDDADKASCLLTSFTAINQENVVTTCLIRCVVGQPAIADLHVNVQIYLMTQCVANIVMMTVTGSSGSKSSEFTSREMQLLFTFSGTLDRVHASTLAGR